MTRSKTIDDQPPDQLDQPLPEAVRQRVVETAAALLGGLKPEEVPAPLRRVARFEPRRRAKLAATPIAAQLECDTSFRERVAESVRTEQPELAGALESGQAPPAADPADIAAAAYLLRPTGWPRFVEEARGELERSATAAEEAEAARAVAELREQLRAVSAAREEETAKLRGELRDARTEIADLRRKLHESRTRVRREQERAEEAARQASEDSAAAGESVAKAEAELRRLRSRLASAETTAENAKRSVREGRASEDARLRVLLDALSDTVQGLRRELALPSTITRPADTIDMKGVRAAGQVPARALTDNDPALLDQLLTLPQVHLIVDGYNVTKTGYGELPLADQRTRLMSGLGGLASQTKAEVTCVFDGAELTAPVAIAAPRGVRVLFSPPGETADDLIGELVRAEPEGRAVVVVSSDREVADSARRAGARPAPASLLLRRLDRA